MEILEAEINTKYDEAKKNILEILKAEINTKYNEAREYIVSKNIIAILNIIKDNNYINLLIKSFNCYENIRSREDNDNSALIVDTSNRDFLSIPAINDTIFTKENFQKSYLESLYLFYSETKINNRHGRQLEIILPIILVFFQFDLYIYENPDIIIEIILLIRAKQQEYDEMKQSEEEGEEPIKILTQNDEESENKLILKKNNLDLTMGIICLINIISKFAKFTDYDEQIRSQYCFECSCESCKPPNVRICKICTISSKYKKYKRKYMMIKKLRNNKI